MTKDKAEDARNHLSLETGTIIKNWGGKLPFALIYPNSYYIGMSNLGTLKPHIQSGKVRAIAVTGGERYRFAPEVPTLAESGIKGFDSPLWLGVFAPARTPKPIIAKFNEALRETLRLPEVAKRIQDYSQDPAPISLEEFQKMVERDNETAFPMIRASGVRLD